MGNFLDSPKIDKESEIFESSSGIHIGATGMQGWRPEMEDSHIAVDMPSLPDHTFLAVFDGHGGAGAAIFAAKNMVNCLEKTKQWKMYVAAYKSSASDPDADLDILGEAIIQAFQDTDEGMKIHQEASSGKDTSGCTSVTAMITPRHILCANAGDSRCVLGTNRMAKGLSEDHKPEGEIEKKRIESAGGTVQWKRVNGDLAVSRALGDFQYKDRPDLPPKDQKVTNFPDITIHTRSPQDDVLLLACDGLWDVMTNNEAIDLVRKILGSGVEQVALVAEEVVDVALEKGSRDNISAIVARLPGAGGVGVVGKTSAGPAAGRLPSPSPTTPPPSVSELPK